ncbi:hypothetical protein Aperf_G00000119433 [Anoplocephala perfoliata]
MSQLTQKLPIAKLSTGMGGLFSRRRTRVTEHDKAVLQLKKQRDELKRYSHRATELIDKDIATIKELANRNQKDRALLVLKKKKYQEKLLAQAEQHLTKIESLISDIEFAQVQAQVVESIKKGNEALTQLNALMKLNDVEKILSDAQEAQEYQEEVSALIAGNLTTKDDAEVEAEFQRLLEAELPEVPDHEVPQPNASKKKKQPPVSADKPVPVMATG